MQVWDGRGTARLFEVDNQARAMLLERLDSTRSLQSEPLHVAILVIAELIRTLAVPVSDGVPSTAAIAAGHIQDFERDWQADRRPHAARQLDVAIKLASERASEPGSALAVDGDLHCRQVLASDRAPLTRRGPTSAQRRPRVRLRPSALRTPRRTPRRRRGHRRIQHIRSSRTSACRAGPRLDRPAIDVIPPLGYPPRSDLRPTKMPTPSKPVLLNPHGLCRLWVDLRSIS